VLQLDINYRRTRTEVLEKAREMAKSNEPEDIFEKNFDPEFVENSLLNKKQASNIREKALREERGNQPRGNVADQIKEILTQHQNKGSFVKIVVFTEKDQLPIIMLYDDDMIREIRAHCGEDSLHPSVLGFDKTFDLSNCLVTILVYKQNNLVSAGNTLIFFLIIVCQYF
jgi:hypothetical protein